jgi:hypothetical protein
VPVTEIATVAGKWTGLMEHEGSGERGEDFVEVAIDSSGTYRAFTARTIGVMNAAGTVVVSDGKLLFRGDRGGDAVATLYTQSTSPQRTLRLEGATSAGRRFSARLRQEP